MANFKIQPFGNYYLLERIAVGGMAEIFKAKQFGARGFEKIVVIKKILQHLSQDPEFVEMFEDEAKIAAQLNQANIVQIYELGEVQQTLYITMEYVEGRNLRDIIRAASTKGLHLSIEQSIFFMIEVMKGLDFAHRKTDQSGRRLEIVHRDISPQNIMVSFEGEVKILDFGIAKAASRISKTEAGVLKGKFSYMSPEQASGRPMNQTSDIYACGVILHELLTSERLFRAKTDLETLERVKQGHVAPPSEKNNLVSPSLDAIVLKALKKSTAERYQSAGDMLNDLSKLSQDHQLTYTSQDLTAFMKSIFADDIAEEHARLKQALKLVPATPPQDANKVRSNITFKRPQNETVQETTRSRKTGSLISRPGFGGWFYALIFLVIIGAVAGAYLFSDKSIVRTAKPVDTHLKSEPQDDPADLFPDPILLPPTPPKKQIGQSLKQLEKEVRGEEEKKKVEEPKKSAPKQVTKKVSPPVKKQTPPKKVAPTKPAGPGKVKVALPTGILWAQIYVNDKLKGYAPGNAGNIVLNGGLYKFKCESSKMIYEGQFEVITGQQKTLRCDSLPSRPKS